MLLTGGILDFVEGKVAALTGRATAAGAILDSTLDRFADAAVCIGLLVYFGGRGHDATAVAAVVTLAGSSATSYVKALAEAYRQPLRAGLLRRQDRVVLLAAGLLLSPLHGGLVTGLRPHTMFAGDLPNLPLAAAVWALAILTNLSALQRLVALRRLVGRGQAAEDAAGSTTATGESLRDRQLRSLRAALGPADEGPRTRSDE